MGGNGKNINFYHVFYRIRKVYGSYLKMETNKYQELIKDLKKNLPFVVYPTKHLSKSLLKQDVSSNEKNGFKVIEVENSEDIGGIVCHIKHENANNILIISLTYLKVNHDFTLRKKILQYKRQWIKNL